MRGQIFRFPTKVLNAAAAAVIAGAAGGVVLGAGEIWSQRFVQHGTWILALRSALRHVERGLIAAALVVLAIAIAIGLVRGTLRYVFEGDTGLMLTAAPRLQRAAITAGVSTLLLIALLFLANRHWLPHKLAPVSLAADLGLVLLVTLASRWLARVRWESLLLLVCASAWRKPAAVVIAAVAVVHLGALALRWARAPTGPSVILIVVDTLRADHLGAYGHPTPVSPHIDRLAEDSAVYENAIAPAPWTAPSVASLLTARTPPTLQYLGQHPVVLAGRFLTLAELFRDRGYHTQGIVSHTFVSSALGFDQGFEAFDESQARGHAHVSSRAVSDKALEFLARRGEPFLLFLHYFDPHYDFILHEGHEFGPDYDGCVRSGQPIDELLRLAHCMELHDVERLRSLYESEIAFTDEQIGRVLRRLKELDLYDDSLIVLTADHGEEFLERGDQWIGHTRTLYQELIHVPLIVKRPGPPRRETVSDYLSLTDLMPLIAGQAGLSLPPSVLNGEGGAATFEGERPIVSETRRLARLQAIIDDGIKLIWNLDTGRRQLFDLRRDPAERNDLFEQAPAEVQRLSALLEIYRDWTAALASMGRPLEPDFTEEQLEQLRSLGYVD